MNKNTLMIAGASLLVTSCAQSGLVSTSNCETYRINLESCKGDDNSPIVTLNIEDLEADTPYVCARRGRTIIFKIEPSPDRESTVAIVPKNGRDTWLVGTNSPSAQMIKIKVPNWVSRETDHEYAFMTDDGGCLDPRVRVR